MSASDTMMRASEALLTPAQLAERLQVDRDYVYAHAVELGAIPLPSKPNPKLAFQHPSYHLARSLFPASPHWWEPIGFAGRLA